MFNYLNMQGLYTALFILFSFQVVSAQMTLPDRMFADTAYAPFYLGVASGSPTSNSVQIWTHVTPVAITDTIDVDWEVATDSAFANVVASGITSTNSAIDFTVNVSVSGLSAYTKYFYRFAVDNTESQIGRTLTAPTGASNQLRLAVMSCSSIFSGYFNAYARLGERTDIDVILHLGDHIYDFVDQDEQVRVPTPLLPNPGNLEEYRQQYRYYLLDPDFRLARQMHPWIVIWDNHDIEGDLGNNFNGSIQAFYEYVPVSIQDATEPEKIYKKHSYGDLLDIFMIDTDVYREKDTLPDGSSSTLGTEQRNWLFTELSQSTATWKVIGNQKLFSTLSVLPGLGNLSKWDDYEEERALILDYIDQQNIDNTIVVSGDAHMAFFVDLTTDPDGSANIYEPSTGNGAVGIEMLGGSISRGNLDEATGLTGSNANSIEQGALSLNPNYIFIDMVNHGYGLLDIKPDSTCGEFYFSEILSQSNVETFGGGVVSYAGENHWRRVVYDEPLEIRNLQVNDTSDTPDTVIGSQNVLLTEDAPEMQVIPNPNTGVFDLNMVNLTQEPTKISIIDLSGKLLEEKPIEILSKKEQRTSIDLSEYATGVYILRLDNGNKTLHSSVVIKK